MAFLRHLIPRAPAFAPARPGLRFKMATPAFKRHNASYQPTQQPPTDDSVPNKPNPHREFYYTFGSPILKVFLGALFTYELLYYGWLKLETIEMMKQKNDEIKALERQLAEVSRR